MKGSNLNKEKNATIAFSKECSFPFDLLKYLIQRATPTTNFPFAMTVSTADPQTGHVSSRILSLRALLRDGLIFQAAVVDFDQPDHLSTKGREIEANPYVAVNFWFDSIGSQASMSGRVHLLSDEDLIDLDRSYDSEILDSEALLQKKVQPGFATFLFIPDWIRYMLHNKITDFPFFESSGYTDSFVFNWKRWPPI